MLQLLAARAAAATGGAAALPPLLRSCAAPAAALASVRDSLPWTARAQVAAAAALLSVAYLSALRRAAPPGWRRAALVPPVVFVNAMIPLLFDVERELLTRIAAAFLFTWLANFKVRLESDAPLAPA